jgi:hypothetical protein
LDTQQCLCALSCFANTRLSVKGHDNSCDADCYLGALSDICGAAANPSSLLGFILVADSSGTQ